MTYCDYCGKSIEGLAAYYKSLTAKSEEYDKIVAPLWALNPHKNIIRRWFWQPDFPFELKGYRYFYFCDSVCFEDWKALIKTEVERIMKEARA